MSSSPPVERDERPQLPSVERLPVIAIVGRPNVGKSTLFNRLLGERKAIVEDEPGVTRDRNYGEAAVEDRRVMLIDTGGFDPDATDLIWSLMREQVDLAVGEADVILFLLDTQHGLTHTDREIYRILKQANKHVLIVVNKADNPKLEIQAEVEGYELGADKVLPIAAHTRRNLSKLRGWIVSALPADSPRVKDDEEDDRRIKLTDREKELLATADIHEKSVFDELDAAEEGLEPTESLLGPSDPLAVAVVGKPNAGKSTLINSILGKERLMTSEMPGTTRDSIDSWVLSRLRPYLFIDTAGVRKKARISDKVERFSVIRALESIRRADVVLLVVDAGQGVTDQDKKIAHLAVQYGKAVVILVNKWDLVTKDTSTAQEFTKEIHHRMPFLIWAPILYISALSGKRVVKVYDLIDRVATNRAKRVRTGACNRTLRRLTNRHQLPIQGTRRPKLYFGSQVEVRPPTFLFFGNEVGLIRPAYQRYLERGFRENFDLEGSPMRILFRNRQRSPSKRRNPGHGKGSAVRRKRARKASEFRGRIRKK